MVLLLLLLIAFDAADLGLASLVHHLAGNVLLDDDLVWGRGLHVVGCFGGHSVDVFLLLLLVERFVHGMLIGGCGGAVIVDIAMIRKLHGTLCWLEVAGQIQTGWGCISLKLLLLMLDLLLVLLGQVLQEVLLQVIVGHGWIELLTKGKGLLLVCQRFRCSFDLGLDLFTLQLLKLQFQLGKRLWRPRLVWRVSVLRWPGGSLVETFPFAATARRRAGLIDLVKVIVTSDRIVVMLLL